MYDHCSLAHLYTVLDGCVAVWVGVQWDWVCGLAILQWKEWQTQDNHLVVMLKNNILSYTDNVYERSSIQPLQGIINRTFFFKSASVRAPSIIPVSLLDRKYHHQVKATKSSLLISLFILRVTCRATLAEIPVAVNVMFSNFPTLAEKSKEIFNQTYATYSS